MATFMTTLNPTPFGYYNSDPAFQADADKMVVFVLRKLGETLLSVELTKKEIWTCFEEATLAFNAMIIEYQAKSNLSSLLGTPTGSLNSQTGFSSINLTNTYVRPNLEFLVRQAEPYAAEVGYGGSVDTYSGSIQLQDGRQDYDLYTELKDYTGATLASFMPSGSSGRMKIHEVYHANPHQYVFNSNAGINFAGFTQPQGEGYAGVSNATFYVLPLFEDVLRAGMLQAAGKVRRSHYSYRLAGRNIRIFPMPQNLVAGVNDKLWIRISYPQSGVGAIQYTDPLSSSLTISGTNIYNAFPDGTLFGASNPANVPFGLISYQSINPWARYWIFQFTLALAKELLGLNRSKIKSIPLPSGDLTLNGEDLVTQAREDKEKLLEGETGLRATLEGLTYSKLAETNAERAENEFKQLKLLPIPPSWIIKMA